ncbi:MAG: WD40 repeat domain-containing protein [Planctomycetales bacterium]
MAVDPTQLKLTKQFDRAGMFFGLARVPGTSRVFVGASDAKVYDLDLAAEKPEWKELAGHESYVTGVALAANSAVSGAYDGKLIWWDIPSGSIDRKLDAHSKWIRGVTASRDGKLIASFADDMLCKVWNAVTGELLHTLAGHQPMTPHHYPSMLYVATFSADGQFLATADKVGHIVVWSVADGQPVQTLEAPLMYTWDPKQRRHSIGGIRSLAFSPDGKLLAAGGTGQINNIDHLEAACRVEIFDWREGKRLVEQPGDKHKGLVERMEFSPAGDWIVAAGGANDGFVMFLNVADGKILHQDKCPVHVYDFELLDSQESLIACGHGKVLQYDFAAAAPPAAAPPAVGDGKA